MEITDQNWTRPQLVYKWPLGHVIAFDQWEERAVIFYKLGLSETAKAINVTKSNRCDQIWIDLNGGPTEFHLIFLKIILKILKIFSSLNELKISKCKGLELT